MSTTTIFLCFCSLKNPTGALTMWPKQNMHWSATHWNLTESTSPLLPNSSCPSTHAVRHVWCCLTFKSCKVCIHGSELFFQHIPKEFGGQRIQLSCSSNLCWAVLALKQRALFCWKRPLPPGNTCSKVYVGGVCQSNANIKGRAEVSLHNPAQTITQAISHSASWGHIFPREMKSFSTSHPHFIKRTHDSSYQSFFHCSSISFRCSHP